jgi:hypothetical protein
LDREPQPTENSKGHGKCGALYILLYMKCPFRFEGRKAGEQRKNNGRIKEIPIR